MRTPETNRACQLVILVELLFYEYVKINKLFRVKLNAKYKLNYKHTSLCTKKNLDKSKHLI